MNRRNILRTNPYFTISVYRVWATGLTPLMKPPFLALLSILLLGCSESDQLISQQIEVQFKASNTAPIDLSKVGPASWERVCVLTPYTTNKRSAQVLGFSWNAELKTNIATSDHINVLVFLRDQQVVAYTEHPRNLGDFSKLKPPCLIRSQAIVKREQSSPNWVYLVTN